MTSESPSSEDDGAAREIPQYKVFVFSSRRQSCRCEIYDWDGRLVRSVKAKDAEEARAMADRYIADPDMSATKFASP